MLAAAAACLATLTAAPGASAFSPQTAGFAVRVRGEVVPYRVFAVYVLPGETLDVEVVAPGGGSFALRAEGGAVLEPRPRYFRWRAPEAAGLAVLHVVRQGTDDDAVTLHAFVMVPSSAVRGESLNGYKIGAYPDKPLRGLSIYRPPRGFVEVRPESLDVALSPHFRLRQFVCKQEGGFPKYVVLRERLLLKLEHLLELVNREGYAAETFAVLSGYRTPWYNRAIGNVEFSRHLWGGAADVFIDEDPRDGVMDDLDGNGTIDEADAAVLYDLFEREHGKKRYEAFVGGLGNYGPTPAHGPFVHVDARGFRARWGR